MLKLIHHIDTARWICSDEIAILIAGWCVSLDGPALSGVRAVSAGEVLAETALTERGDVAAHLQRQDARRSGFSLQLPPLRDGQAVDLLAFTATGETSAFWSFRESDLPGRMAFFPGYAARRAQGWPRLRLRTALASAPEVAPQAIRSPRPLFSVLLPTFNTPERLLREGIDSVLAQRFDFWELCIADDASDQPATLEIARAYAARDARIRLAPSASHGGIARATNRALHLATGEFVVLLDHDDRLAPEALGTLAAVVGEPGRPACDIVYSDEEKIDDRGAPTRPILKPDFSPLFLCGVMYIGHPACVRRQLALDIGGFDPAFDRIQDYEFLLRASVRARRIVHLPEILYQWRMTEGSIAVQGDAKGNIDTIQLRAVEAHLARIGWAASARAAGDHRVIVGAPAGFSPARITIYLREGLELPPDVSHGPAVEVRHCRDATSAFDALRAAPAGTLIGFIGLPLVACSTRWLEELSFLIALPDSARVSPVIVGPSGRVLEAGLAFDAAGNPVPLMTGFDPESDGYHGTLRCSREVDAASSLVWIACAGPTRGDRFDRVCAAARVRTSVDNSDYRDLVKRAPADLRPARDELFHNPRFDRGASDYRLESSEA